MSRFPILAALCLAALPVAAQAQTPATGQAPAAPEAPAAPPPAEMAAVQTTAAAFGQCVQTAAMGAPATVTPEAAATSALSSCAPQQQSLVRAVEALIATLPEAQRAAAQEQLRTQMGGAAAQIAAGIRQMRASQAGTPAPAATPAQ